MGYFATKGTTSYRIFALFWDAVTILEGTCDLKVITIHLFQMELPQNENFADVPHLIKTARNGLSYAVEFLIYYLVSLVTN